MSGTPIPALDLAITLTEALRDLKDAYEVSGRSPQTITIFDIHINGLRVLLKGGGQERPTTAEWDLFTDALDRLQPVHLDLLATVVTHNLVALRQKDAWKRLPELRPDVTPAVRLRCWEDLAAVGVLQPFAVLTADDDESGLEDTGQVITVFGVQFVAFLDLDQVRAEESRS